MAIYAELQKQPLAHVREALRAAGVETDLGELYGFSAWWRARLRFLEARARLEALAECLTEEMKAGGRMPTPASALTLILTDTPADKASATDSHSLLTPTLTPVQVEEWGDFLFLRTAVAEDNLEGYVKLRGIMERSRRTRLDERRMALLEARAARMENAGRERQKSGGGLSPETLELMESMLGMMQS